MKKLFLLLLLCGLCATAQKTQKLEEYTAANGITYKVGEEFELNRGSDTNGKFVYVNIGGWAVSSNAENNRLGAGNAGLIVTIKKIKKYDYKRYKGVYFTVGGGNLTNYTINIEKAIESCEVKPCKEDVSAVVQESDKYDKLAKIKKLLDDGILSQEEYEAEKKKILESQ